MIGILWHQRFTDKIDVTVIKWALSIAIEDGNDRAVLNAATICAARSDKIPRDDLGALFVSAIGYFKAKGNTVWADAIWPNIIKGPLIDGLSREQIDILLSSLVSRSLVDHQAEYVLAGVAKRFPEKVIDFFGERLRHGDEDDLIEHYESLPYRFTTLGPHLAGTAAYLVAQSRAWHREKPDHFEFRGGRLVSIIFPEFSTQLEALLKEVLSSGGEGAPRFVVDLLSGYRGAPATHELYKQIVEAVSPEDPLLGSIEVALIATGVVSGEFGMVEAYRRKKVEFQPWLKDPRPRVAAYAERHDLALDRMIASEQRRSEEDLEARKREYGDDGNQSSGQ